MDKVVLASKIVLASGNPGKLKEFQQLLNGHSMNVIAQSSVNVTEAEETGLSFVENAIIKARNASRHTGLPAIADDSGLEVDALKGEPGIYSARYAGPNANDADNNIKLLHELRNFDELQRSARFQCLLVFLRHKSDPTPLIFQGTWEGRILFEQSGENGFGYDPLFFVPEHNCSSATLPPNVKNKISHRGKAMAKLLAHWNQRK
jgi:non-canonical purine NTP pyrophosphatase (RdgB/HAM1 family)